MAPAIWMEADMETTDKLTKYHALRPAMGTGDVLEFASDTLLGKLIRWKTGHDVNHTSMIIRFQQYDTDRVFLLEALEHGIVLNLLSKRLREFSGKVFWLPLAEQFDAKRRWIGQSALKYVGVKYDYDSILKQLVGRVSVEAHRLFCSEFVYLSLRDAAMPVYCKDAPQPGEFEGLGVFDFRERIL